MQTAFLALHEGCIKRSHNRCLEYGIAADRIFSKKIISDLELEKTLAERHEMIVTIEPFMNQLYKFVKGSGFFSVLTDSNGCILRMIGDENILSIAFSLKMIPGAFMDERSIGTNAMGTALAEGEPIQVSGKEHFVEAYQCWTCSGAPIRDIEGKIVGALNLTGYSENVHSHTLGMVVASIDAVEKMLQIQKYNEDLTVAKNYADAILNSIPAGILTSDPEGSIKTLNSCVAEMFGLDPNAMQKMKVPDLIEGWDKIRNSILAKRPFLDEDVFVTAVVNKLQFNLSAYPILDGAQNVRDIILVFKEVKKVRKLANKIMGRRAIYTFDKIIGKNAAFLRLLDMAKRISDSRSNILLMGESGTGKELFAQAIHNQSNRRDEPFIAINCGAIPKSLIESELFGYEGGSFTGAKTSGNPGKFEVADGGTVFLDEIGEMPHDMQSRLLRVIEEGTVGRIGGSKEIVVDVRIIAASNKNLHDEVAKENFRTDLFYRLNVLPLTLPPLRERRDDIPLLIEYFMDRISRKLNKRPFIIPESCLKDMASYEWPGNIRELENMIELMLNTDTLPSEFLPAKKQVPVPREFLALPKIMSEDETLAAFERRHIERILGIYRGNVSLTARALHIGRNTLYRKIDSLKIDCSTLEHCTIIEQ